MNSKKNMLLSEIDGFCKTMSYTQLNIEGEPYEPESVSLESQIIENSNLIKEIKGQIKKEPTQEKILSMTLASLDLHQRELILAFGEKNGLSAAKEVMAVAIETPQNNVLSVPMESISAITDKLNKLMHSIQSSYKKRSSRSSKKMNLCFDFACPFAGSFGFFVVPSITYSGKKPSYSPQIALENTANTVVMEPLRHLLSSIDDDEKLKKLFNELGTEVAEEYERYLKVISTKDISVAMYASGFSFHVNKDLADKGLDKMLSYYEEPREENIQGQILGIYMVNNKKNITFVPENQSKFEAVFNSDLYDLVHDLFSKKVTAVFSHKIEQNLVSGKRNDTWELINLKLNE